MRVKRYGNAIFGADLTAAEKKAVDIEVRKACLEAIDKMEKQVDVVILWQLHSQEHWGKARLERFYRQFINLYDGLRKYYQSDKPEDTFWVMEKQLQEIGVNVDDLMKTYLERDDICIKGTT